MKLKLLQHLSGVDGVLEVGTIIDAKDEQALVYIEKGIAEAQTEKAYKDLLKKAETIKAKKAEDEAKAKAILEQSVIQNELNELYLAIALKEAELNGEVLSDDEVFTAVEAISKRDAMDTKKAKGK